MAFAMNPGDYRRTLLLIVCSAEPAHAAMFNEDLNLKLGALMMFFILTFSVIWEEFTEQLESRLSGDEHYAQMLAKVYRELIVAGFISLLLLVVNNMELVEDQAIMKAFFFSASQPYMLIYGLL
jgi:hypothetical protein